MPDGFTASADLADQAEPFRRAAEDLVTALDELRSALGGLGYLPGHDDPGERFAEGYQPNTANIEANVASLARGARGYHVGVSTMAVNYHEIDWAKADSFRVDDG